MSHESLTHDTVSVTHDTVQQWYHSQISEFWPVTSKQLQLHLGVVFDARICTFSSSLCNCQKKI